MKHCESCTCFQSETTTPHLLDQFTEALKADPDLAWSWHCNLAMPIMDRVKCSHTAANEAAADLMRHLFHIDIRSNSCWAITVRPEEPGAVRAGVSVKDPTPPQELVLCAAMGPSGFICERLKGHPGHHRDGDNRSWSPEKASDVISDSDLLEAASELHHRLELGQVELDKDAKRALYANLTRLYRK